MSDNGATVQVVPKPWFLQPQFIAAMIVLGGAALGLNSATQALKVHFKKEAVPLREKLDDPLKGISAKLGPWVKVMERVSLDADLLHELATDKFAFRHYVDGRIVPADRIAEFKGKSEEEQEKMIFALQQQFPDAVVKFAVTYYTGLADRVAHVPDVCMVAGGYQPTTYEVKKETFTMPDGTTRMVPFRFINFEDQTGRQLVPTRVGYFFNCNGGYTESPQEVRYRLQNLWARQCYYAKLELMCIAPNGATDTTGSLKAMNDIIGYTLPELERCLPDWDAVTKADKGK